MSAAGYQSSNFNDIVIEGLGISTGDVYPGSIVINKFGFADNILTTSPPIDIWSGFGNGGGDEYTYSTSTDIDSLSSSDAGDTQTLLVIGLDTDFAYTEQFVVLTGQTTTILSTPLIRVHRMINISNTDIAGTVFCYPNGSPITAGTPDNTADVRALIDNGNNITEMTQFTTPTNFDSYLLRTFANIGSAAGGTVKQADVEFRFRAFGTVFILAGKSSIANNGTGSIENILTPPPLLPPKGDLVWKCTDVSANSTTVNAGFSVLMIPN